MAVSGLIPIVVLGTLILIFTGRLLLQWSRRNHTQAVTIEDYSQAREALDSVFAETAAIKRIFAHEDMEFISEAGTGDVQRFFLKERKRLAIQWVRMTQKQVAHLMDLHLKLAGYTYEPSPRSEVKLTINYLCFILASNGLLILLWLFGPFEAVRIVAYTVRAAEYFCSEFSIRLEKIDPVKLSSERQPRPV
jgi:hypothetical protein